tara:strand:- start:599 stop:1897 length:1299 start_codon:yes stop_codon:yes gene_type:complete
MMIKNRTFSLIMIACLCTAHAYTTTKAISQSLPSVASLTVHLSNNPDDDKEAGTGFVYDKEGHIITNAHVVGSVRRIIATFQNNQNCFATVIGADRESDVAVLQVDPQCKVTPIKIGNDSDLKIGDEVIAIGNPFGLSQTVTKGIVSSLHRDGIFPDSPTDFIQIDAAINPGNSGGPLVNTQGEVIGINTAIIVSNPNGNAAPSGLGLAIPINIAKLIASQLIETGMVSRGYIGVASQELTPSLATYYKYPNSNGLAVTKVVKGSPADLGGLAIGDIITHVNGMRIDNITQLPIYISSHPANSKIQISIWRSGRKQSVTIRSISLDKIQKIADASEDHSYLLSGVTMLKIDAMSGKDDLVQGLEVIDITSKCNAFLEGLRRGDIITHINEKPTKSFADLERLQEKNSGFVKITINRHGQTRFIAMRANIASN